MIDSKNFTGIQHIGMPVSDMDKTIRFYEGLGFKVAHQAKTDDGPVTFLKLGTCVLETWLDPKPPRKAGAINHISLDVLDIDKAYEEVRAAGYPITTNGVEALPFWEKGVRFFTTEGPDCETVEFCEIIK